MSENLNEDMKTSVMNCFREKIFGYLTVQVTSADRIDIFVLRSVLLFITSAFTFFSNNDATWDMACFYRNYNASIILNKYFI